MPPAYWLTRVAVMDVTRGASFCALPIIRRVNYLIMRKVNMTKSPVRGNVAEVFRRSLVVLVLFAV